MKKSNVFNVDGTPFGSRLKANISDNKMERSVYEKGAMLDLCQEFIDDGYNPEIIFRKGDDSPLSECDDYVKANITAAIVDIADRFFCGTDKVELMPLTIYGVRQKTKFGYQVRGDGVYQAVSGMMYDDKSCFYLWIYIDESKLTPNGRRQYDSVVADNLEFDVSEDPGTGWAFCYGIE